MNLINIAYSGSKAAQAQLNATAMNTANIYTPGYSRQRIEMGAIGANGAMNAGNGVEVTGIRRIADQYLIGQLWQATSSANYYKTSNQYINKLESMLGDESTSLSTGFDNFFAALNEATTQPDNRALRQQIINEAGAIATRFNTIDSNIASQQTAINQQRTASVELINTLSKNIAGFNQKIMELEGQGGNANALRDQRDELVKSISELADIRMSEASDGSYTITLKDGQPLVSGRNFSNIATKNNPDGSQSMEITFAGTTFDVDMSMGGQIGALYDYEVNVLGKMQETIAGMAEKFAESFNEQLSQSFDLNDNSGKPLFTFDPSDPKGMLQVNPLSSDELALSNVKGESGNGSNLTALIEIKNKPMNFLHLKEMSLNDATATIVSDIGITSRQIKVEAQAAVSVLYEAQSQRDNLSGVDKDEEAVNLVMYTKAYQSNLKVMATGDRLFSDLLALF